MKRAAWLVVVLVAAGVVSAAGELAAPEFLRAMPFVAIAPGAFPMGSDAHWTQERPAHRVLISRGFQLGQYEVPQREWREAMGTNPSTFKGCDDCPVDNVAWPDVEAFLAVLDALDPDNTYRLPTEAEWEYAARAGSAANLAQDPMAVAWFYTNASDRTHPVGQKLPNGWGLHDMYGNVWEWCSDWYNETYYQVSPGTNPTGPRTGINGQIVSPESPNWWPAFRSTSSAVEAGTPPRRTCAPRSAGCSAPKPTPAATR